MNLQELITLATDGQIRELELLSLEGGFYIVRAQLHDKARTLLDSRGKAMHLHSATQLRDLLRDLPSSAPTMPCVLVQHVVHDELCGVRQGPIEPLRLPISLSLAW
ncbi:hypothetical protein SAMN05216421_1715 [Halopseudomonas xinjiangensis]|uniref:Metal ABC transporter ATPase n=1 Tax=Halopseudomonas xinjiangensis TaxID=487184 RepID=A0A1H1T1W2_9GAMM|nr:DUF6482 family protein [Halopseudomonas xinjiangensis]SDS54220.1 hypothetical protein SAMN05216421_1715 [Halopseudomonas xinjiangensis]